MKGYDGIFLAGSPIQMHEDAPETRAAALLITEIYAAGMPAFGSCAGLQIAAVAAGGTVRPFKGLMEMGFAQGITRTEDGSRHVLLEGHPNAWDAPAMHASLIDRIPAGGTILAHSEDTPAEAVEIRHEAGDF